MTPNSYEIVVTPAVLKEAFSCNREIEFTLTGHPYFAQPCADRPQPICYQIWDASAHKCIFRGRLEDLFSFTFPSGQTLVNNFEEFDFLYIL